MLLYMDAATQVQRVGTGGGDAASILCILQRLLQEPCSTPTWNMTMCQNITALQCR